MHTLKGNLFNHCFTIYRTCGALFFKRSHESGTVTIAYDPCHVHCGIGQVNSRVKDLGTSKQSSKEYRNVPGQFQGYNSIHTPISRPFKNVFLDVFRLTICNSDRVSWASESSHLGHFCTISRTAR